VIDDDPAIVTYLSCLLVDNGYEVRWAGDGAAGLALVRQWVPDLICLDIAMPEPTGVRVYRQLRADPLLASIPVIMVTGVLPQFKEFIHHRRHVPPPSGYIQKPFDAEELLRVVGEVLAARHPVV
jgi:CheY-like chemotaxis protein